jgi:hypothetical protein
LWVTELAPCEGFVAALAARERPRMLECWRVRPER